MSDLETLETTLLGDIAAAGDETAIEAVRLAALGKKGSISERLKTLGAMAAEERQTMGPALNGLKRRVTEALTARRAALREAAIAARLSNDTVDVTLPVRPSPAERGRVHPISQVIDEIAAIFGDLGFTITEGPGHRNRLLQLHRAELTGGPSGARDARHLLPQCGRVGPAQALAYTHLAGADPHHGGPETADPHRHPRQDLPARVRRHAHADVPSARRAGDRSHGESTPTCAGWWGGSVRRSSR